MMLRALICLIYGALASGWCAMSVGEINGELSRVKRKYWAKHSSKPKRNTNFSSLQSDMILRHGISRCLVFIQILSTQYTPDANMVDHSVGVRDESEASQAVMFCFDSGSPERSSSLVDLVCFTSLCLRVAVLLNASRRDRNFPPFASERKCNRSMICNSLRPRKGVHDRRWN